MMTCIQCGALAHLRSMLVVGDERMWRELCESCAERTRASVLRSYVLERELVGGTALELRYEPRNELYGAFALYDCRREGCTHDADARAREACYLPLDSDQRGADARWSSYLEAVRDWRSYVSSVRVGVLADDLEASADAALRELVGEFNSRPSEWWLTVPLVGTGVGAADRFARRIARVKRLRSRAWSVRDVAERGAPESECPEDATCPKCGKPATVAHRTVIGGTTCTCERFPYCVDERGGDA